MRVFRFAHKELPKDTLLSITNTLLGREVKATSRKGILNIEIHGERTSETVRNEGTVLQIAREFAMESLESVMIINNHGDQVGALRLREGV